MRLLLKRVAKKTGLLRVYHGFNQARNKIRKNKEIKQFQAPVKTGFYCIGCGKYWTRFKPLYPSLFSNLQKNGWPFSLDQAQTLNYENHSCYYCEMADRDRLYAIYISAVVKPEDQLSVVDFAPSAPLSNFIKRYPNIKYRTSDLFMEGVDDHLDIQDLHKYSNEQFDFFICSHILEHVDDDLKSMKELYRITKKGGWGIAMVPIIMGVETTHEDPAIKDKKLRMKYFGQDDHVRLYAKKDFVERLSRVGFQVEELGVSYFGKETFIRNGISLTSVLYIAHK